MRSSLAGNYLNKSCQIWWFTGRMDLSLWNRDEFIFVIIESKHICYSLSMSHKITSVLLRIIRLKTLIPDILNWLYYPEQNLPFSQVNYLSQCRVEDKKTKLSCSEYPHNTQITTPGQFLPAAIHILFWDNLTFKWIFLQVEVLTLLV